MNKTAKFLIVVALIAAVCGIIIYKHYKNVDPSPSNTQTNVNIINTQQTNKAELQSSKALPRLIDLGADKCIPCKMMASILEELKKKYAEVFNVEFIDVWRNPDAAQQYNIRVIPTQIFFDASGKELFRHEGFFSKQDILAKWKELGVDLSNPKSQSSALERNLPSKPDNHTKAKNGTVDPPLTSPKHATVKELYPDLTRGSLNYSIVCDLPEGVLLKAPELLIHDKELREEIAKAQEQIRPKLEKNGFLVLEQLATFKLLLAEAKAEAAKSGTDISGKNEQTIIQDYVRTLAKTVKISDSEILDFYNSDKETLGGAALDQVKPQIEQFLLQQKQQEFIDEHIRTIGKRMRIEISAPWLKVQAALAKDNPVDKARASGRPSLVDFGSTGCVPCDMLAPILETLKEKYKGKVNVVFVHVGQEPILASRYGIQAIPVQIFFDQTGKEVFRHVGFFPQEQIEKKLSEMGVK